jgi:hypothetical protein
MDKGTLQAYLDGELTGEFMEEVRLHLDQCAECRTILEELQANSSFVRERLTGYEKAHQTMPVNTSLAWERFVNGSIAEGKMGKAYLSSSNQWKGWIFMLAQYRKTAAVWKIAAAGLILAFAISLFFQPVRTLASQFLSIFRVDRMQTISISPQQLEQLSEIFKKNHGSMRIRNFGEISIIGDSKTQHITKAEVIQKDPQAKLPETFPGGYGLQNIDFNPAYQVRIKLKMSNVNDLLRSLGAIRLLPMELDGKIFEIHIPALIGVEYKVNQNYLELVETRSPELIVPEGVSADAVRESILQLPFLPPELASQLRAINDWQHILVIPNSNGNAEQVFIGGNSGIYFSVAKNLALLQKFFPEEKFERAKSPAFTGAVMWQADGRTYLLCGNADKTTLLSLAGTIR